MPARKKQDNKDKPVHDPKTAVQKKTTRSGDASREAEKLALDKITHELEVHQIELEMQNEELRRSQLELEESRTKYQDLYDFSPVGYFTITREAIIAEVNLTGAALLGVPRAKLIHQRFRYFVADHDLDSWFRHTTAVFQQEKKLTCVLELKRAGGTTFHARLESVRKESAGAAEIRTVVMDVSERVKAEENLRDSEHRLRRFYDSGMIGVIYWNMDGRITEANDKFLNMLGYTRDDLAAGRINGFAMTPPEYRHIDDFSVAELKANGVNRSPLEKEYVRKDGTRIPVILSGAMLDEARTHGVAYVLDNTERKRAEKSLKESEDKYRLIVENTGDNITVLDMNFRITYTSPSITKLRGYSVEEVMAQTLDQIFLPESLKKIGEVVAEQMALEAEGTADPQRRAIIELEEYCKDGSRIWVEDVFTFIRDDSGRPTGILSVSRDITDRKRLEMEIQKSESRFRGYFDMPLHGIAVTSPDKGWLQVNDRLCAMLGYDREVILRKTWVEMTYPEDLAADIEQFNRILSGEINQYTLVKRFIRKDGQIIWTSLAAGCVREPDGSVDYMIALLDDITDRKRAEDELQINNDELVRVTAQLRQTLEGQDRARLVLLSILEDEKITRLALRESEEKHRTLFETMAQGVVYQDAAGAIMTANPAAQRILGLTLDQMMGRTSFDPRWKAVHEDGSDYPGDGHPAMKALKTGDEVRDEIMGVLNPELNTFRWISINAIPRFRQGEDRPYQVYTTFTDITELKLAEQQARYQLQFLYIVINAIKAPIFFKDTEGRYSGCNAAFEEYVGHPLSELIGKTVYDLWPRELADHYHRKDLELLEKGGDQTYETRAQFTDGTHRDVMYHKSLYHGRNGSIGGIVGVMLDITDRKKAEQALRESEERLRVAMEATQIGIWDWDLKNDIWQTTPIYYTMLGYEPVEGPSDRTVWLDRVHPEDRAMVEESIKTVLQQKLTEYQYEARLRHADGSYRWVNVQGSIVEKDADGNPTRILGIRMDVTDRKRAEEAVHESERFAQSTVNALEANIAILDGIGDIISVNRSWREFAYENSEDPIRVFEGVNYLAVCDEASGERFEGAAEFAAGIRSVITGDRESYSQEYPCHSPSSERWFVGKVTRFPGEGPVRVVVSHHNITERKRAEEKISASLHEKEVLLREIHHRVKNNMQVISSLIGLQNSYITKGADVSVALGEMQNRIKSMAIVHEKLYRSENFARIDFREYLTSLSASVFQSLSVDPDRVALRLNVGQVTLGIDEAVPCGLLVNELVTNALKHGFPGGRKGVITVSMEDVNEGGCRISIKDDGVGLPEGFNVEASNSLGIRLVGILTKQIGGTLEVRTEKGTGSEFVITFPVVKEGQSNEGK